MWSLPFKFYTESVKVFKYVNNNEKDKNIELFKNRFIFSDDCFFVAFAVVPTIILMLINIYTFIKTRGTTLTTSTSVFKSN